MFQQQVLDLDDGNVLAATDHEILGAPGFNPVSRKPRAVHRTLPATLAV
jgi:hypothetical protein